MFTVRRVPDMLGHNFVMTRTIVGLLLSAGFVSCLLAANWLSQNIGQICGLGESCHWVIPVRLSMHVPVGILAISLALVLRNLVQRWLGLIWSVVAICVGGSFLWVSSPPAVFPTLIAYCFSQFFCLAVFTPLQRRRLVFAVFLSGLAGLTVYSCVLAYLTSGSTDEILGSIAAGLVVLLLSLPVVWLVELGHQSIGTNATRRSTVTTVNPLENVRSSDCREGAWLAPPGAGQIDDAWLI
jgi:queuosine precursor transporter